MLENLQSMNLRSATASPASVMGTPPRHPGSATAELPRRVTSDETRSKRHHICFLKKKQALLSANSASSLQSSQSHQVSDSSRPSYLQSPKVNDMFLSTHRKMLCSHCLVLTQTPPASTFRKLDQDAYNSLPRQSGSNLNNNSIHNSSPSTAGNSPSAAANKRAVVFGKHFQLPSLRVSSKRSSSAPNLGDGPGRPKKRESTFSHGMTNYFSLAVSLSHPVYRKCLNSSFV